MYELGCENAIYTIIRQVTSVHLGHTVQKYGNECRHKKSIETVVREAYYINMSGELKVTEKMVTDQRDLMRSVQITFKVFGAVLAVAKMLAGTSAPFMFQE